MQNKNHADKFQLSMFLISLEALKVNFFLRGILYSFLVIGFRPILAGESFTIKTPNFAIFILLALFFFRTKRNFSKNN